MWHTVFIKNEDFILYESEKAVKIKLQELFKDKDFSKSWE